MLLFLFYSLENWVLEKWDHKTELQIKLENCKRLGEWERNRNSTRRGGASQRKVELDYFSQGGYHLGKSALL